MGRILCQEISNRTHVSRTPKPEYLIARSQLIFHGPLGFGPIQFLMDLCKGIWVERFGTPVINGL